MSEVPHCCYIDPTTEQDCTDQAYWSIWKPPDPYDVTEACTVHVGDLLEDARHEVWPLAFDKVVSS